MSCLHARGISDLPIGNGPGLQHQMGQSRYTSSTCRSETWTERAILPRMSSYRVMHHDYMLTFVHPVSTIYDYMCTIPSAIPSKRWTNTLEHPHADNQHVHSLRCPPICHSMCTDSHACIVCIYITTTHLMEQRYMHTMESPGDHAYVIERGLSKEISIPGPLVVESISDGKVNLRTTRRVPDQEVHNCCDICQCRRGFQCTGYGLMHGRLTICLRMLSHGRNILMGSTVHMWGI